MIQGMLAKGRTPASEEGPGMTEPALWNLVIVIVSRGHVPPPWLSRVFWSLLKHELIPALVVQVK